MSNTSTDMINAAVSSTLNMTTEILPAVVLVILILLFFFWFMRIIAGGTINALFRAAGIKYRK